MNAPGPSLAAMALNAYGQRSRLRRSVEVMAALTVKICRMTHGDLAPDQIAEDIADVEIMLEQLRLVVRQHTGTDATMDEARRGQRAKALADAQRRRLRG